MPGRPHARLPHICSFSLVLLSNYKLIFVLSSVNCINLFRSTHSWSHSSYQTRTKDMKQNTTTFKVNHQVLRWLISVTDNALRTTELDSIYGRSVKQPIPFGCTCRRFQSSLPQKMHLTSCCNRNLFSDMLKIELRNIWRRHYYQAQYMETPGIDIYVTKNKHRCFQTNHRARSGKSGRVSDISRIYLYDGRGLFGRGTRYRYAKWWTVDWICVRWLTIIIVVCCDNNSQ